MSFFKLFPTTQYAMAGNIKRVVDLFRHVDVNDLLSSDISNYRKVRITDGERPDNLSYRLYGTPDFYWTFFILNENLKNGIDDWPASYNQIEKEMTREFDPLGIITFNPSMKTSFITAGTGKDESGLTASVNYTHVGNTWAGLDLSYEDLKVYRNFETASIVKWDNYRQQLVLSDFSNKNRFMADPKEIIDTLATVGIGPEGNTWERERLEPGLCHITFNDWPIIGKDGEDGQNFDYLSTMTTKRTQWIISLFEWFDSRFENPETQIPNTPMRLFESTRGEKGDKLAALDVFKLYFSFISENGYKNGITRFAGFEPYRRVSDDKEHAFFSAREAPFCYYNSSNYINENKITGFDALNKFDPSNYVSYYQHEIDLVEKNSDIKVVKPTLISQFVEAYEEKLNSGLTRRSSSITSEISQGVAGGNVGGSIASGTTTSSGGGGYSAPSGGGGGGGY
jgi:hypothetical protein